jgi:hypothetical protein
VPSWAHDDEAVEAIEHASVVSGTRDAGAVVLAVAAMVEARALVSGPPHERGRRWTLWLRFADGR